MIKLEQRSERTEKKSGMRDSEKEQKKRGTREK